MIKLFIHYHEHGKETISTSANTVAEELMVIWTSAAIKTRTKRSIVCSIKKIHKKYQQLLKCKSRVNVKTKSDLRAFKKELRSLFDITADTPLNNSNTIQKFLEDQRTTRKSKINNRGDKNIQEAESAMDDDLNNIWSESESQSDNEEDKNESENENNNSSNLEVDPNSCDTSDVNNIIYSSDVMSAIDRANITDNQYTMIAGAIVKKLQKVRVSKKVKIFKKAKVSRSTVRRRRMINRKFIAKKVKENFKRNLKYGMIVHFDGKLMTVTTNAISDLRTKKIERVAVAVSGHNETKLLGVRKINEGTGKEIAKAVKESIDEWECSDHIVGMSFDTTAVNTGEYNGACKIMETKMKKNLLYFACRHHILELLLGTVFCVIFGSSTGPDVSLFKEFRKQWSNIDKTKINVLGASHFRSKLSKQFRASTIDVLQKALSETRRKRLRDGYKELCQLSLIVLGVPIPRYKFRRPGAHHHARWMAKAIYSLKMYIFRNQMNYSEDENIGFSDMCLFVVFIYARYWILCTNVSDASLNDLNLYKDLHRFKSIDKEIADSALNKLTNHLWYLSPEMVPLSLFSSNVPIQEKKEIIANMIRCEKSTWKKRTIKLTDTKNLHKKSLSDLVDSTSLPALRSLRLDALGFMLESDPNEWSSSSSFFQVKFSPKLRNFFTSSLSF